jgi:hypothetical protein
VVVVVSFFEHARKCLVRDLPFQACHRHLTHVRMSSSPAPPPAGGLQRSPSLRNTAEEDGLRRALEIVRAQGEHFKSDGMSPTNFFVGLMNVGVSAFMLGRCPEYYWVYASVRIPRRLVPPPVPRPARSNHRSRVPSKPARRVSRFDAHRSTISPATRRRRFPRLISRTRHAHRDPDGTRTLPPSPERHVERHRSNPSR